MLGASKRSAGQTYKQTAKWKQVQPTSERLRDLIVQECVPEAFKDCDLVFSGLNSDAQAKLVRMTAFRLDQSLKVPNRDCIFAGKSMCILQS